jgi:hypothetical protein
MTGFNSLSRYEARRFSGTGFTGPLTAPQTATKCILPLDGEPCVIWRESTVGGPGAE